MAAETVENHSFTSKYSAWKKQPPKLSFYLFIDICFYQNGFLWAKNLNMVIIALSLIKMEYDVPTVFYIFISWL